MGIPYGTPCCGAKPGQGRRAVLLTIVSLALLAGPATQGQAAAPKKLLTLGDSLTAGYGLPHEDGFESQLAAALAAAGHPVHIIDGGISGDTSAGGLARLDWVLADHPDAAIVELGANDGLRGLDPKEMDRNLTAILDKLAAAHIPVLLCGMFAPPNLGADYGTQFRAVFDRLSRRPGLLYDPFFLDGVAGHPDLNQADGLHPTAAGVKIIVARLLPLVEKLLDETGGAP
jgi:acyl-CoA thioesterase-1